MRKMHEKKNRMPLSSMVSQKSVRLATFLFVITRLFFMSDVVDD